MIKATIFFTAMGVLCFGLDLLVTPLPPLGGWAYAIFPEGFPVLQPAVERHISPWIWGALLQPIFVRPVTFLFFVLAFICAMLAGIFYLFNRPNVGRQ